MKKNSFVAACLLTIFILAACTSQPPTMITPTLQIEQTVPKAIPPEPTESAPPPLDETVIRNFTFQTPANNKTITLVDSAYEGGEGETYFRANILSPIVFGDLNQDGLEDAGVLLGETAGGSGFFVSLIILYNQDGAPVQGPAWFIDDRPVIHNLAIRDGLITLDATIHDFDDPMTDPTFLVSDTFLATPDALILTRRVSKTLSGEDRAINIESPLDGAQVSAPVQIKGNMPIGPFENNLLYTIYDQSGSELARGPFGVESNGMGGPATFDQPLESLFFTPGASFWIELSERSMADGSALALVRFKVTIK